MTEVGGLGEVLAVPIVGEFHQGSVAARALALLHQRFVLWRGEENERVAVLLVDPAARLFEPELVAVEVERLIEVAHAQHGVQISHRVTSWYRLEPERMKHTGLRRTWRPPSTNCRSWWRARASLPRSREPDFPPSVAFPISARRAGSGRRINRSRSMSSSRARRCATKLGVGALPWTRSFPPPGPVAGTLRLPASTAPARRRP